MHYIYTTIALYIIKESLDSVNMKDITQHSII